MRMLCVLALAASVYGQDGEAIAAMRLWHGTIYGSEAGIEEVRDRMVAALPKASNNVKNSVRRQLDKAFKTKYKRSDHYHKCLAQMIAAAGKPGYATLYNRFSTSKKRHQLRISIAEAIGETEDPIALSTLLKMVHDKTPEVAAAAVKGCGRCAKAKGKKRKDATKTLIDRYIAITDAAGAGKPDSREVHMYKKVKPEMDTALKALTKGESYDSGLAWKAWFREAPKETWQD